MTFDEYLKYEHAVERKSKAAELPYSEKSKRISSYKSGKRIYGWQKDFEKIQDFEAPF